MLKRISCEKLADDLVFHDGANFIVGDGVASNSIGKTTALLLIDFAFGGSTYGQSEDIAFFIGDHVIEIEHVFDKQIYRFKRSISQSNKVTRIRKSSTEEMSLSSYNDFLKDKYGLQPLDLSFRNTVGLYSRIWGKRNIEPLRILSAVPNESGTIAVARLIKLYQEYEAIGLASQELKKLSDNRSSLIKAQKHAYLPKYTKSEFEKAKVRLRSTEEQIASIAKSIAVSRESIEVAITPRLLRLQKERSDIAARIAAVESHIALLENNLKNCSPTSMIHRQLAEFRSFFPKADMERIEQIESFHMQLNEILTEEITEELNSQRMSLSELQALQKQIDDELADLVESPPALIGEVEDLTRLISEKNRCNEVIILHSKSNEIDENIHFYKADEEEEYETALQIISSKLNSEIAKISATILPAELAPRLDLWRNKYSYKVHADSGTGRAYAALVIFDLSILESTILPFFMHDSICLKNIEVKTLNNIINKYESIRGKQIFVSLDEIQRLEKSQRSAVKSKAVVFLSKEHTLFGDSWK